MVVAARSRNQTNGDGRHKTGGSPPCHCRSTGALLDIAPELALQFARDCSEDFEAVYCFDCRGRSRTGIVGDIGSMLGLCLSGRLEQNYATLREWGASHRALVVIAGVRDEDRDFATPGGLTSAIFTKPLTDGLPGVITSRASDAVRRFDEHAGGEDGIRLGWVAVRLLQAQERFAEVLELLDSMWKSHAAEAINTPLCRSSGKDTGSVTTWTTITVL